MIEDVTSPLARPLTRRVVDPAAVDRGSQVDQLVDLCVEASRTSGRLRMLLQANAALADLEKQARDTGSAIGIVSALPVSVEAITEWAAGLAERGIEIVPASALMGDQT